MSNPDQDWETVTFTKSGQSSASRSSYSGSHDMASAKASGQIDSVRRYGSTNAGGGIVGGRAGVGLNLRKIEDDTDNFGSPKTVSDDLSRALMDARNAKRMTQKQLAAEINVTVSVIQAYENGTAIPQPNILNKIDRALGIHLPRSKK